MREQMDCALLAIGQEDWLRTVRGSSTDGRLVLHALAVADESPAALLADAALLRGRYDAALVHVHEGTLSAWRKALAARSGHLPALLMIYAVGLHAQAIRDLLAFGATDFMRPPFCIEELRARIEHNLSRSLARVAEPGTSYGPAVHQAPSAAPGTATTSGDLSPDAEARLCETILARSGTELEAYATALATQRATSRASFRAAKGEVIARFERAYIHAALGRHGGNITRAAMMAQKHRRAFWELMRKHSIDPLPYRTAEAAPRPPA